MAPPRREGKRIGLVPTMGFFHEGHLSLMRCAREGDDVIVVSLYVNPTQFGPAEDYLQYPRDVERDSRMAREAGVDLLFAPSDAEIYPAGAATFVEVTGELVERFCAPHRPGHFRGVATVVAMLFDIVVPHRAYFGEKDYQQLQVVRRLARDLHMPVEVVGVSTVREPDGLAMSSRNTFLTPEQRKAATVLYRALAQARELTAGGEQDPDAIIARVRQAIAQEPLVKLQYAELGHPDTLAPVERVSGPTVLGVAAHVGGTRLIDNIIIGG